MSDLDTIDDIYETSKQPAGPPCHPHQAKARRQFAIKARMIGNQNRNFQVRKSRRPITLAKISLPD